MSQKHSADKLADAKMAKNKKFNYLRTNLLIAI